MIRLRALLTLSLACAVGSACTERGPTAGGDVAPLDLRPSFQVDPVLFPSSPIDRIRLLATDAATSVQVGSADVPVSPTATQWTLSLAIALGDAPSRDVLVDVELLTGTAVQWSGRLGPITVRSGTITPVQDVALNRGPLDNLDVVALDVSGAPTWIPVGGTAVVVANPTLVAGSTVTPRVFWASTNTGVATVTSEGLAATLTGIAAGTTEIIAVAGTVSVELDLEVRANAPPGFDLEWRGATTDWHTASNWSTGQVPTAADDVYIPASAVDPTTSMDVTVGSLTVAAGATLTLGDVGLLVSGNLHADGVVTGGNFVAMIGNGTTVRGTIETALQIVGGTVSASGALATTDLEIIGANALFDVNGQTVDASSSVGTLNGGALRMASASGRLDTVDAAFGGGGASVLSAGALHVAGGFQAATSQSFVAGGTHTTVFEGADAQLVELLYPGATTGRFQNVVFDSPGTVLVISDLVAMGSVTVVQGGVEMSDFALSVGGALVDPSGGLTVAQIRLIGPVTTLPSSLSADVYVDGVVDWPVDATTTGSLFVNGTLDVGPSRTLSVSGTIFLAAGSRLIVDGTLTAGAGCENGGATISGTGQHPCGAPQGADRTWVGGATSGSPIDWSNPDNWSPAGVPTPSETVLVPVRVSQPELSSDASVGGLLVEQSALVNLNGLTLTAAGDVVVDGLLVSGLIDVTGTGQRLQGNVDDIRISGDRTLTGLLYVSGNLDVLAELTVGPQAVDVFGDLSVQSQSGRLVMNDASSYVYVIGNVSFDGADASTAFSQGALAVLGDFSVGQTWGPMAFRSTGTSVLLYGSADQTISFASPSEGGQAFADLYVANSGGRIILPSSVVVEGVLYASNSTIADDPVAPGFGVLRLFGTASMVDVTLEGVPLTLTTTVGPNEHGLSGLTFTQMPPGSNQLTIALPGGGPNAPLLLESPVFTTVPTGSANYLSMLNTSQAGELLVVNVSSPTPADQPSQVDLQGAPIQLVWPYP